jgi:hypothetical protein
MLVRAAGSDNKRQSRGVSMSSQGSDPKNSGIYRIIRAVFGADLVIGLALAAAGFWLWDRVEIWTAGLGLAAVGLLMLLLFPILMRRSPPRDDRPGINRH